MVKIFRWKYTLYIGMCIALLPLVMLRGYTFFTFYWTSSVPISSVSMIHPGCSPRSVQHRAFRPRSTGGLYHHSLAASNRFRTPYLSTRRHEVLLWLVREFLESTLIRLHPSPLCCKCLYITILHELIENQRVHSGFTDGSPSSWGDARWSLGEPSYFWFLL